MEADLQRFYQLDLADYYRGKITFRKLNVLLRRLPPESHVRRLDKDQPAWTADDIPYLIGDLVSVLTGAPHPDHPQIRAEHRAKLHALKERQAKYARLKTR